MKEAESKTREVEKTRTLGQYYTPPQLVSYILDALGYTPDNAIERLSLLDPSCGDGSFLVEAASRLLRRCRMITMDEDSTVLCLARCLKGIDVDPGAASAASARLADCIQQNLNSSREVAVLASSAVVRCGDALRNALPADRRYDLVVGNPPFVGVKTMDPRYKDRIRQSYPHICRQQFDLSGLFLYRAAQILSPGGSLGFIVPAPLLTNRSTQEVRSYLLEKLTFKEVILLRSGDFFDASVEPRIVLAYKPASQGPRMPGSRIIYFKNGLRDPKPRQVFQENCLTAKKAAISPYNCSPEAAILAAMSENSIPLGSLFRVKRGIECGKNHPAISSRDSGKAYPLIRGEDLKPWGYSWAGLYLNLDRIDEGKVKNACIYDAPKLMLNRVGALPKCALDDKGYLTLNTVYNLQPKGSGFGLFAALALLNSSLMRFHFHTSVVSGETCFPYARTYQVEQIPVSKRVLDSQDILSRLGRAAFTKTPSESMQSMVDRVVYEYFGITHNQQQLIRKHLLAL